MGSNPSHRKPSPLLSGRVPGGEHHRAVHGALCLADSRFTVTSDDQGVSGDTVKKHLEGMGFALRHRAARSQNAAKNPKLADVVIYPAQSPQP